MVWRRLRGKKERRTPPDAATGDLLVLAELQKNGANLSQPRDLVHYLYVPSQDAAEKAADELRGLGYTAEAKPAAGVQPDDSNPWLVLANFDAVVDQERVRWERARFDELAAKYRGDYDGWEAAL
jgi:hypothetical protein